eukprot:SAG31_NODE_1205_length_9395_cov_3.282272_1_plen_254_part_00
MTDSGTVIGHAQCRIGALRRRVRLALNAPTASTVKKPELETGLEFSDYEQAIAAIQAPQELRALASELGLAVDSDDISVRAMQLRVLQLYARPTVDLHAQRITAEPAPPSQTAGLSTDGDNVTLCPAFPHDTLLAGIVLAELVPAIKPVCDGSTHGWRAERFRTLHPISVRPRLPSPGGENGAAAAAELGRQINPGATVYVDALQMDTNAQLHYRLADGSGWISSTASCPNVLQRLGRFATHLVEVEVSLDVS